MFYIPELLRALDLAGCIVTIDAIGCQKEIASEICAAKANYVLALKGGEKLPGRPKVQLPTGTALAKDNSGRWVVLFTNLWSASSFAQNNEECAMLSLPPARGLDQVGDMAR